MIVARRAVQSRDELEAEHDDALASLVSLREEHESGVLTDSDFVVLEEGATTRAARALRALADLGDQVPEPRRAPPGGRRRRRRRRWTMVVAVICFAVAGGILVGRFASSRLPGQTITGTVKLNSTQALAEELVQGRVLVSEGHYVTALGVFRTVLASEPNQPEALAYVGWLESLAGAQRHDRALIEQGRSDISQAVKDDPDYPDAHLFLGTILYRYENDLSDALVQFRLFLLDDPSTALQRQAAPIIDGAFAQAGLPSPKIS